MAATAVMVESSSSATERSHCCFMLRLEASWRSGQRMAEGEAHAVESRSEKLQRQGSSRDLGL
jgi:hypothetical protein